MPFLVFALSALLIMAGVSARGDGQAQAAVEKSQEAVTGATIRIVATMVSQYMTTHPGAAGEITTQMLEPFRSTWFQIPERIQVLADGHRAFVIVRGDPGVPPTDAVFSKDDLPGANIGIVQGGRLISPSYAGGLGYTLPAGIPDGSLVYVI
ncbi:type IV pilus biogenesis protein PilM [Castellaniella sp. UC4442_H9]